MWRPISGVTRGIGEYSRGSIAVLRIMKEEIQNSDQSLKCCGKMNKEKHTREQNKVTSEKTLHVLTERARVAEGPRHYLSLI